MTLYYVVELNQTDPPDSPTPGLGHYAGEVRCGNEEAAKFVASRAVGRTPWPEVFYPCCDWQSADTPIAGCRIVVEDAEGNEVCDLVDGRWVPREVQ